MITLKVTDNFILVFNSDLDFKFFLKSKNKRIHLIPLHKQGADIHVFEYSKNLY